MEKFQPSTLSKTQKRNLRSRRAKKEWKNIHEMGRLEEEIEIRKAEISKLEEALMQIKGNKSKNREKMYESEDQRANAAFNPYPHRHDYRNEEKVQQKLNQN